MAAFSRVANGSISPSRFVKLDTTADGKVLQAGAGDQVFGVAQPGERNVPYSSLQDGFAAKAGENINVYGPPERCLLELGGSVTRGSRLKSDSTGAGVTASATDESGAIALASGVSGDLIEVEVWLGKA